MEIVLNRVYVEGGEIFGRNEILVVDNMQFGVFGVQPGGGDPR